MSGLGCRVQEVEGVGDSGTRRGQRRLIYHHQLGGGDGGIGIGDGECLIERLVGALPRRGRRVSCNTQ